jgi:predicted RNase H-like HicB family nuclease
MEQRKIAEMRAARSYTVQINKSETAGGRTVYVAASPELDGCIAQGDTEEEAEANLRMARVDYIESLLEDGLPVPDPQMPQTITTSGASNVFTAHMKGDNKNNESFEPANEDQPNSSAVFFYSASLSA